MRFVVEELGLLDYLEGVSLQQTILEEVMKGCRPNTLLLLEHPSVLTLGANFHEKNLLHPSDWYASRGIQIAKTDRGGDVTFHSPGQLVAYPIFSLEEQGKDLHKWLRQLEEAVIATLTQFRLNGLRFPPQTGVWIEDRKICAMGIKVRRWVSMHGLALNCDNDLGAFDSIIPCGIEDYGVTSLSRELNTQISVEEVKPALIAGFRSVFG
jgi:lipoyl(octanoyl) transferase